MRFTTACCLSRSPGRTLTTLFTALASVCLEYNGLNTKESLVVWETIANQTCSHPSSCSLAPLLCADTLAVLRDGFQEKSPSLSCSLTLVFGPFVRNLCVWFRDTSLSSSSRDRDSFSPVPLLWGASFPRTSWSVWNVKRDSQMKSLITLWDVPFRRKSEPNGLANSFSMFIWHLSPWVNKLNRDQFCVRRSACALSNR